MICATTCAHPTGYRASMSGIGPMVICPVIVIIIRLNASSNKHGYRLAWESRLT